MRKRTSFQNFDKILFLMPILIFLTGILSIYSASFKSGQPIDQTLAMRQFFWMAIGALFVLLIVRVDYFKLQDFVWPLYYFSIFLLIAVLFMPSHLGAHRWIPLGGFNFQPSELAKFSIIVALSQFFSDHRLEFMTKSKWAGLFLMVAVPFLLILKEPDLGTALILIPIFFAMLYLWGFKLKHIIVFIVIVCVVSPVLFHFLKDYQKDRLLVFINPNVDPLGAGYTIIQSKIAIGSGGLFGKGFMGGTQNQLKFIPERHTDFIFAVIAEEGGFIASIIVLTLFWLIVKKGYTICSQIPDRFGSQLACGISTMIGFQTVINLGMTMGLFPVVGLPLPLVSYGGSSVVITMLSIGILLNLKMHRPLF